jgi:hypothetical protein
MSYGHPLLLDEQSVVSLTNTHAIGYRLLIVAQES